MNASLFQRQYRIRIDALLLKTCYQVVNACVKRVLRYVLSFYKLHFILFFGVGRLFLLDCLWLLQFSPILKTLTKSADGRFIKSNIFLIQLNSNL